VNTNQKKYNLSIQILFFVLPLIYSQNSFGVSTSTVFFNGETVLKETVIKITDKQVYHPASLIFEVPGNQKITIENHLQKDVDIGNMYFVGDEFTVPNVSRDIHINSASGCSTVKSGTSCTFVINAAENASPSINNDSELLLLNYKINGEQKDKFVQFKLKLDYNNDMIFKVRNLEFKANEATFMEMPHFETLTMINNNPSFSINIKEIRLAERNTNFVIGDCKKCSVLKSNDSCEVGIGIDLNTGKNKNDVIPIYVAYDVIDANNEVVKKNLIATAAAIVSSEEVTNHVQSAEARIDGAIEGAAVVVPYADTTQKLIKNFFVAVLPTKAGIATDIVTGFLAGGGYFIGDEIVRGTVGEYESSDYVNKILSATTMHSVIAFGLCSLKSDSYSLCAVATIGCGLLGTFGGQYLTDAIYSNVVYRLPEQSWYGWLRDKSKLVFNFASAATIRVTCKTILGVPNGGFTEVYQDASSAAIMVALKDIFKKHPELSINEKTTSVGDDYSSCNECICANLSYNRENTLHEQIEL
jgi:hypothetical protein